MKRLFMSLGFIALFGCGAVVEQKRRTFDVEWAGVLPTAATEKGWTVTLTEATLHVKAVRFYSGKVLISQRAPRFDLYSLIGGSAWAHPGHYMAGTALGERLAETDINLLSGSATSMGAADAVTGEYGSVQLTLGAPGARLKGSAVKNGTTVRFDTTAFLPPETIEGVRFDRVVKDEAGKVHIAVDLTSWLTRIDFSLAPVADTNGLSTFTSDNPAFNGFARGVEDTGSYQVTWQ